MATTSTKRRVSKPRASVSDRNHWYLHEKEADSEYGRNDVSGSPHDPHAKPDDRFVSKRRPFVPMLRPARYRLFVGNWMHTHPDAPHAFYSLPDTEMRAWYQANRLEDAPQPTSYVDPFPGLAQEDGRKIDALPLLTRQEGMALVAERNRVELEDAGDNAEGIEWYALLEYAEPAPSVGWSDVQISANGVGVDKRELFYPVRLVVPTVAELAKYAIVKGGA